MGILGNDGTPFNSDWTQGNSAKNAAKVAKSLGNKVTNAVTNAVNWLTTPKMPDSYRAHGGVGPNGQTGSPSNTLSDALNNTLNDIGLGLSSPSSSKASSSYRSGSGLGSGAAAAAAADSDDPYSKVLTLINETAQKNNEWSAQQAQIDREWQKMMSDTAHVREVADLKAAGLNPVLSAGGNGASTPSGAMAQTDTSNTRLLAEVAMASIEGMAATATGFARAKRESASDNSIFGRISNSYSSNKLTKKLVDTALNTAGSVARLGIVKSLFR